jgi:hypothetical protein
MSDQEWLIQVTLPDGSSVTFRSDGTSEPDVTAERALMRLTGAPTWGAVVAEAIADIAGRADRPEGWDDPTAWTNAVSAADRAFQIGAARGGEWSYGTGNATFWYHGQRSGPMKILTAMFGAHPDLRGS